MSCTTLTKYVPRLQNKRQSSITLTLHHSARNGPPTEPAPLPIPCIFWLSPPIIKRRCPGLSGTISCIQSPYANTVLNIHLANSKWPLSRGYPYPQACWLLVISKSPPKMGLSGRYTSSVLCNRRRRTEVIKRVQSEKSQT